MKWIGGSRHRGVSAPHNGEVTRRLDGALGRPQDGEPRPTLYEAAHKGSVATVQTEVPSSGKVRSFNEAAHKLGDWPTHAEQEAGWPPAPKLPFLRDENRDVVAHAGRLALALGALGVVYGDIGTSPLYTEQVIFTSDRAAAHATVAGVYGIVSLIFWALMIVVTIKYAGIIMRAHNRGDGGIMALTALVQRRRMMRSALLVMLGVFGASLFFGDGMITPAISVLSAVQGLNVVTPSLTHLVVPISLGILVGLFLLQRRGTGAVGRLFGPVLLIWFAALGILGAREVIPHPGVLAALSPVWGARFMVDHGVASFLTLGGVVLAITGAEALYADRGHFGASPIRLSWLAIVFPSVLLSYLGQAALILQHPRIVQSPNFNPFLELVPSWGRLAMVFLATAATIIASQAVISGSFSVARQAMQLGFLPRLRIRHTSKTEGQIYVPVINWTLAIGVVVLIVAFQSSTRLADMYGVAVTATFVLNTLLFLAVARSLWHVSKWKLGVMGAIFLTVEVAFFSSNMAKVAHGAWLPLAIGILISLLMMTWRRGQVIVTRNRTAQEGSLQQFLVELKGAEPPIRAGAGHQRVSQPRQGDHSTGPTGRGRAQPCAPGADRDRVAGLRSHSSCQSRGSGRRGRARRRSLQSDACDRESGLPGQASRPGGARAGAQAGPLAAQPRPRACLLLPLSDHPCRGPRRLHALVAQAAVLGHGAQCRQPHRAFRTAAGADRRDGLAGRGLRPAASPGSRVEV